MNELIVKYKVVKSHYIYSNYVMHNKLESYIH